MRIESIAVFCGSKMGSDKQFAAETMALGRLLVEHKKTLIYGGGNRGLMGVIANTVMDHGGKVIGVIPKVLLEWEAQHEGITELHVVEDMHVRKKMMYELCDVAIILPGGNGTLDGLFEMLTWNQLNIHSKKIILLNVAGFYDHLVGHIEMMNTKGFLYDNWRERLMVCADAADAIACLL